MRAKERAGGALRLVNAGLSRSERAFRDCSKLPVREARPDDAAALGAIHVRAWLATYRGLIRDHVLDALDEVTSGERWHRALTEPLPPGRHVLVVVDSETDSAPPAGFAIVGPDRDGEPKTGELQAINLDPAAWGKGLGRELLTAATELLAGDGFGEAVLWVVAGNTRARRFYERAGWVPDGRQKTDPSLGTVEVRYRRSLVSGG